MGTRQSCMYPCLPGSAAALAAFHIRQDAEPPNRQGLVQVVQVPVLDQEQQQQAQDTLLERQRKTSAAAAARFGPGATWSTKKAVTSPLAGTSNFRFGNFCLTHIHKVVGFLGAVIFLGIGIIIIVQPLLAVHTTTTTSTSRTSTTTFTTTTFTSTSIAATETTDGASENAANAGSSGGKNQAQVTHGNSAASPAKAMGGDVTVLIWMTVQHVDYAKLTANPRLLKDFKSCIHTTLAKQAVAWLVPGTMQLGLKPGSVRVNVTAGANDGNAANSWRTKEGQIEDLQAKLTESVNGVPGLEAVCTGTPAVNGVGLAMHKVQGVSWILSVSVLLGVVTLFCVLPVLAFGGMRCKKRKDTFQDGYQLAAGELWSDPGESPRKVPVDDAESNADTEEAAFADGASETPAALQDESSNAAPAETSSPGDYPVPGQGVFAAAAAAAKASPLVVAEGKGSEDGVATSEAKLENPSDATIRAEASQAKLENPSDDTIRAEASQATTGGTSISSSVEEKAPLTSRSARSGRLQNSDRTARSDRTATPRSVSSLSAGREPKGADSSRSLKPSSKQSPRTDSNSGASGSKPNSARRSGTPRGDSKEAASQRQRSLKTRVPPGGQAETDKKPAGNPEVDYFRMAVEKGFSVKVAKEILVETGGDRTAAFAKLCERQA